MDEHSSTDDEIHNANDSTIYEEDENCIRRSFRACKPSQKVRDNLAQESTTKFWNTYKECKLICDEADNDLQGYCSTDVLSLIITRLKRCLENIDISYIKLRDSTDGTVPPEVRMVSDRTKEDLDKLIKKARSLALRWDPVDSNRHSADQRSQRSRRSSISGLSSTSLTSSKRILLTAQTAALQAELLAKKKEASKKAELSRLETEEITRRAEQEAERSRLDANEKIRQAKFKADLERKQRELEDEQLAHELQRTQTELGALNNMSAEDHEPILVEERTIETRPPYSNDMRDLAKTFADSINLSRLPAPEPSIFNGDPLSYPSWKAAFSTLVESRGIPPLERLHYLRKYLGGEAKEAVAGTFYFESEDAYKKAQDILQDRYGNSFLVAEAFRDKLQDWPKLTGKDGAGLRKLSDFLLQCQMAMQNLKGLEILNDCRENRKILMKLPDWLIQRWSRIVAEDRNSYPSFNRFATFIKKEADIACNPITSINVTRSPQTKDDAPKNCSTKKRFVGANTIVNELSIPSKYEKGSSSQVCVFCKRNNHTLHNCRSFISKTPVDRKDFLRKSGLCFGCLCHGHLSKDCANKNTCDRCNRRHPTCLHGDFEALNPTSNKADSKGKEIRTAKQDNQKSPPTDAVTHRATKIDEECNSSMIVPIYLSTREDPDKEILVYAMLDTQSDTTFILEETREKLQTSSEQARLKLSTMTSTSVIDCHRLRNLQIRGMYSNKIIPLPTTYSREYIPVNRSHIPTPATARRWTHLKKIEAEISPMQNCEVGLLIGYNCPQALAPRDFIRGHGDQPFAQKTDLGWSIIGRIQCTDEDNGMTHRLISKKNPDDVMQYSTNQFSSNEIHYVCKTMVKEEMTLFQVSKLLEADFPERKYEDATMSQDDLNFMKVLQHSIHQDEEGYYEMPLPFRHQRPELPNNEIMARKRLEHLKRRLRANPQYCMDYRKFIEDIVKHGDAEEISDDDSELKNIWYIPHHGVYHPKKPEKIRVVFDCSARYKGTALNDHLLQGPDLMNSLIGVLCRFRERPVAVMGDIERMFHQFRVNSEDRDYLRFLWWKDGNLDAQPTVYRMKVHLFGATSSPGCANFGLKKIASDYRKDYDTEVSDFIMNDFYVDDGLRSFETVQEATNLIRDARHMLTRGNLRLHKFVSNSHELMNSIPPSEHAKEAKNLDFKFDNPPIERALGLQWCIESDCFQFRLTLHEKPLTRRGILSTVASVYDPLGCLAPFVLIGKQLLQQLCKENTGWDQPLSDELRPRWEQWLGELPALANIKIRRCFVPAEFGHVKRRELHHFSDASFSGYGQCSYLRLINDNDEVHCSLVMGKSRVTPQKVITMPRLELTAALVSVKISNILRTEMNCNDIEEHFWTDSKVVLGYINNDARRFHIFVANRVQQIKDATNAQQWKYISTDQNPADHASRGLHPHEFEESSRLTGPDFLWKIALPKEEPLDTVIAVDDPEVKRVQVNLVKASEPNPVLRRLEHFSDWSRAVTAITYLQALISQKKLARHHEIRILEDDRCRGELTIIKMVQGEAFAEEIKLLSQGKNMNSTTPTKTILHRIDGFLDDQGVFRVGGRLDRSSLLYGVKHPIILPKSGHVVNLIIKHCHERVSHQGRGFTVNELRSNGYWILGCSKAVSSHIYKCITCRRLRGRSQTQKMADLPQDRLEPSPPFTYCGADCFGPFYVKEGRRNLKRYGLLFTCMASRAIHIETLDDMTTDAFINGLRCFIALRGPVRTLRCDQGSNFVGAAHEFKEAFKEVKEERIRNFLISNHCDFIMNSPASSHMGGVWERQIRTTRNVLTTILHQHGSRIDTSSLRTFLYEAMAIVNSRPLTTRDVNDSSGPEPLTPNHLLTMKSKVVLPPPGNFPKEDVFARKRWRQVQHLANEFWSRWKKEYLQQLQRRQKWNNPKRNISVGDIVILKDEDLVRAHWKLARVTKAIVDDDGLVRRVELLVGDSSLSKAGKRLAKPTILERPIHKLTVLLESTQEDASI